MLSKAALLCLESSLFLRWELFNRNAVTNTPQERKLNSEYYKLRKELRDNPSAFFEYFNMSVEVYDYIYLHVRERLDAAVITIKTLSSGEKLFITLRYLAKGMTLKELSRTFLIGCSTASKIINDTLIAIWECLHMTHLNPPKPSDMKVLAGEFFHKWRFPNCIGAIGGKYVAIHRTRKTFSKYYWKRKLNKSSIVLHAVVDADLRYLAIDVKGVTEIPDYTFGGALTHLECMMQNPPDSDVNMPIVVIGNKAYPLKRNIMRPYPPRAVLNNLSKQNFNNRLESARVVVDYAFQILADKWKIFQRPSEVGTEFAARTVKVTCLLHNIIKDIDGMRDPHFCKFGQKDYGVLYMDLLMRRTRRHNRATALAVQIREQFEQYLMDHA